MTRRFSVARIGARGLCVIAVILVIISFFIPVHDQSFTNEKMQETLESRQLYLWGERVIVGAGRPAGQASGEPTAADIPFSPFDDSTRYMFAITLCAALSIPFLILGSTYMKTFHIKITRFKVDFLIENPFNQRIYIGLAALLLYFAVADYLYFLYAVDGTIVIYGGMYPLIASLFLATLAIIVSGKARTTRIQAPLPQQ